MFAKTDPTAVGALVTGLAAGLAAIFQSVRNRRVDTRDDMEQVIDALNVVLDAERKLTDRQVAALNADIARLLKRVDDLTESHAECERKLAKLGVT